MMSSKQSNLKRMDNIGIVVESLDAVVPFFEELGLKLEGRGTCGEIVQYEDVYRLCYIRGPEQILIGLAEEL